MLLSIREKTKSWLAWVIVFLISIPFALFGIESYFSASTEIIVAKVNDTKILLPQYQNALSNYRNNVRARLDNSINQDFLNSEVTKKGVLDGLIGRELLKQHLENIGYHVTNQIIMAQAQNMPEFQVDNKFDLERYRRVVTSFYGTEARFKSEIKLDLLINHLKGSFVNASIFTNSELENLDKLITQTRNASLLTISDSKVKIDRKVSTEDLKTQYDKNKELYVIPVAVKVAFVELSTQELAKKMSTTKKELNKVYQENKTNLLTNETRDVSHIMLLMSNRDSSARYLKKINNIRKRIIKGADFAKLAKLKSDDTGSADLGGRLGYKEKNTLGPELAKVLFSMKKGEISKPVRSKFGYHILKLHNIKTPKIKTFSQAKSELIKQVKRQKAKKEFANKVEDFSNLAYEQPDSLQVLVDELALPIKTSDWITKAGGKDVFRYNRVVNSIFSDAVLQQNQNSDVIEINSEHLLVFRKLEYRPKAYKTIEQAQAEIEKAIFAERNLIGLTKKGDELVKQLKDGKNRNKIAKNLKLRWENFKNYQREDKKFTTKIINELFSMPKPNSNLAYRGVSGKKYTIIALKSIKPGNKTEPEVVKSLRASMSNSLSNYNYDTFIEQLKSENDVTVFYKEILEQ